MSKLVETLRGLVAKPIQTDLERPKIVKDWYGKDGYYYKIWSSSDGIHRLFVSVAGGPEYSGRWMRDIRLEAGIKSGSFYAEIIRIQEIIEKSAQRKYNVYLDALTSKSNRIVLVHPSYGSENDGVLRPSFQTAFPMKGLEDKDITDEEFYKKLREELLDVGVYELSEVSLYPEIDVKATVDGVLKQIEAYDFGKPKLVRKSEKPALPSFVTPH